MSRPTGQRAALLRAVKQAPESDEPRLAFARWLAARPSPADKARAEFIELQIAWARPGVSRSKRLELRLRDRSLRQRFEAQWLSVIPAELRSGTFSRGFLQHVSADAGAFLRGAHELFAHEPPGSLSLWNTTARLLVLLADCPSLAEVRELSLCDYDGGRNNAVGALGIAGLASSPYVRGLEVLDTDGARAGDGAISALASSPHLGSLRSLTAAGNDVTPSGVAALASCPLSRRLQLLHLGDSDLGGAGVAALCGGRWRSLRDLGLSNSRLDASLVTQLLNSERLPHTSAPLGKWSRFRRGRGTKDRRRAGNSSHS